MTNALMSWGMVCILSPVLLLFYTAMERPPLDATTVSLNYVICALALGVMEETRVHPILKLIGILAVGFSYAFFIQYSMEECWAERLLNFL